MAELDMYNLYSMGGNYNVAPKTDEVDGYIKELVSIDDYDEVADFVQSHFGQINGERLIEYPDINKQINIHSEKNKIEICVAKDRKQYWGKGWLFPD